ncbi:MAG: hypothetical protein LBT02_01370 [Rickettsiales bacterium]|jgi:NTP pyrophosphatase (non-canonical NTP hydrolase)|nr:hypothetical protein [Rickettsiales bacterium]
MKNFFEKNGYNEMAKETLKKWGNLAEVFMLFEEMAEFQKEICKNINRKAENVKEITEEMGDVIIVLEQMRVLFGINDDDLQKTIDYKVNRLKGLLEK